MLGVVVVEGKQARLACECLYFVISTPRLNFDRHDELRCHREVLLIVIVIAVTSFDEVLLIGMAILLAILIHE